MAEVLANQHAPAVKVGGRRLSISVKHKHHVAAEPTPVEPDTETVDYPRPAAPGEEPTNPHPPPYEEEAPLRREKKHASHENEKRLKELAHHKAEVTRPTKDMICGNKGFGAGGRIAQPAGKALNV